MKAFCEAVAITLFLVLASIPIADAQQTLPPVTVTANACGYGVTCVYPGGGVGDLIPTPAYVPPLVGGIPTKEVGRLVATCKSLREYAQRNGCNTSDPPSAPLYPSPTRGNWVSNGCGDGSLKVEILRRIATLAVPGFAGDLTNPLPGVSFASPCASHDSCYYHNAKGACDDAFASRVTASCQAPAPGSGTCAKLAWAYTEAVKLGGGGAYNADQLAATCARISADLRRGNCVVS